MIDLIMVKPKKGMIIYDLNGKIIPEAGLKVENCKYYRSHLKDGSLVKVETKKTKGQ